MKNCTHGNLQQNKQIKKRDLKFRTLECIQRGDCECVSVFVVDGKSSHIMGRTATKT